MKVIYKYQLHIGFPTALYFPNKGKIVKFGIQNGYPMAWVEIDHDQKLPDSIQYFVVGTGIDFDDNGFEYFDSVIDAVNGFVWHMYVLKGKENA